MIFDFHILYFPGYCPILGNPLQPWVQPPTKPSGPAPNEPIQGKELEIWNKVDALGINDPGLKELIGIAKGHPSRHERYKELRVLRFQANLSGRGDLVGIVGELENELR